MTIYIYFENKTHYNLKSNLLYLLPNKTNDINILFEKIKLYDIIEINDNITILDDKSNLDNNHVMFDERIFDYHISIKKQHVKYIIDIKNDDDYNIFTKNFVDYSYDTEIYSTCLKQYLYFVVTDKIIYLARKQETNALINNKSIDVQSFIRITKLKQLL